MAKSAAWEAAQAARRAKRAQDPTVQARARAVEKARAERAKAQAALKKEVADQTLQLDRLASLIDALSNDSIRRLAAQARRAEHGS